MIFQDEVHKICFEYGIGKHLSIDKINQGVLNDNYVLTTTTGKYFIKSVREKAKNRLKMIYEVELLMKSRGIPAVVMLKTKSDKIFLVGDDQVYTVYPFIESDKTDNYLGFDFRTIGKMLGIIHLAGSGDISGVSDLKQFKRLISKIIFEKLKSYKKEISNKSVRDDIDKQFLKYINLKLIMASKIKPNEISNDTLIHGDFHPGNLLIDKKTGQIIGVCDWEKSEFGPRTYELARSLLYSCFPDGYKSDRALTDSKLFLDGYLSVYPMCVGEIMEGFNMRIFRMTLSSWIEDKYYKEKDNRANHFIGNEMRLIYELVNGILLKEIRNSLIL